MDALNLISQLRNRALPTLLLVSVCVLAKPVVFWVNSPTDQKYYLMMIERYKKEKDPAFEAEVRSFGFTEMPDKLAIAIKSGVNTPDLVQLDEIYFSLYLRGQIPFVDITDRVHTSEIDKGMLPQRMGLFTWKDRLYGLPQSVSNVVLYYREDLFQELKITPSMIDTWDKFEEVARKIKTPTRGMIALDWSYFEILLRQRGFEVFGKDGSVLKDSAAAVGALQRVIKWHKEGIGLVPDRGTIFEPEFFNSYVANNGILTVMSADWYGLDMIQNMDPTHKGKWRAMALPIWTDSLSRGKKPTSSFSGQGLVIYKGSKQVDRTWKFMEWVMKDNDANVSRFLEGNCFTPYKPAWTDPRLNRPEPYFGNQNLAGLFMELAPKVPFVIQSPQRAQFVNLVRERFWGAVISGSLSAEDMVKGIKIELKKPEAAKP